MSSSDATFMICSPTARNKYLLNPPANELFFIIAERTYTILNVFADCLYSRAIRA